MGDPVGCMKKSFISKVFDLFTVINIAEKCDRKLIGL